MLPTPPLFAILMAVGAVEGAAISSVANPGPLIGTDDVEQLTHLRQHGSDQEPGLPDPGMVVQGQALAVGYRVSEAALGTMHEAVAVVKLLGYMIYEDRGVPEVDRTHGCHTTLGTRSTSSGRYSGSPVAIHTT